MLTPSTTLGVSLRNEKPNHPASPQNLTEKIFCVTLHSFSDRLKKSARASAPESSRSQWLERLTDAVNHLAEELRVVRDVMDEIREDLGWITRNGIPGRHGEHKQLVRMARDPLAPNANASLRVLTSTVESANSSELAPDVFDELVSEITEAVTVIGQEQVNLLLTALDDARAKLVAAIKASSAVPNVENALTTSESLPPATKPTGAGRLF